MDDEIWQLQLPKEQVFPIEEFLSIGFTHHICILTKVKEFDERLFYIKRCAQEHYSVEALKRSLASDDFHHQGELLNNFLKTIPAEEQAFRAVNTFKDEYLLDYINVEELNCLVAVELKKGKFKTSYLGQLSGYLSVLDELKKALPDIEALKRLLDTEEE